MRRVVLLLATMIFALLLVSGVAFAQPAPRQVPDASCQLSGPLSLESSFRSSAFQAQTFKAEHTGLLTSARVKVEDGDIEPVAIIMEIRTVDSSGTPTKVVEASTTIPASDVPDRQFGEATGVFRSGARVEAGHQYAIVLHTSTGEGIWAGSNRNPCPGVNSSISESTPGVFQTPDPKFDVFFSTFVTPGATTGASTKGGGLPNSGGLPVFVPAAAVLALVSSGAVTGLLFMLRQ